MTLDIRDFVTPSCDVLALGEPTHGEPVFARIRNGLFAQLIDRGFRSIALETDRVAALVVNDFVQGGAGHLDAVMEEGFTHGFGALEPNRQLVVWMREYNEEVSCASNVRCFSGTSSPAPADSVADVVARYRETVERANEVLDGCSDLGAPVPRPQPGRPAPSARWAPTHMIEETGRHADHADILRELVDGATGR